ncbi:ACT domain-containing protein [Taklimakanibacter lacteus]|uniref:ACT domain-containing protein n=1 Tax=Taklimakanibacter lacteus TaxID=2268456 RepID=UPI000E666850
MTKIVSDTRAMLAGMTPVLTDGEYVFCTTKDASVIARAMPVALGSFREAEGTTFILARSDAKALGFDEAMPMRRITLDVFSALDGVGLTAGVATALAAAGIPCNMVAAYHHDHVFVPAAMTERAIAVLKELQERSS